MSLNIPIRNEQNEYFLQLDSQLQEVYQRCVDVLRRGELSVTICSSMLEDVDASMSRIQAALDYGCPELFFLDKEIKYQTNQSTITVDFTSKYPSSQLLSMWEELNGSVEDVLEDISFFCSDEEKLYELNEYICKNITTNSSNDAQYGDAYGALVNGEARCEGISKAVQIILNRLNIKGIIAYGESNRDSERENHAWNIIWIKGNPYGFDFTWNIGGTMFEVTCVDYMFLAKDDIDIEHIPESGYSYPIVEYSELAYWSQQETEIAYLSDFSNVALQENGSTYYAVMRLMFNPTLEQVKDEVYNWYLYEMGGDIITYGEFYFQYNVALGVLTIYVITN